MERMHCGGCQLGGQVEEGGTHGKQDKALGGGLQRDRHAVRVLEEGDRVDDAEADGDAQGKEGHGDDEFPHPLSGWSVRSFAHCEGWLRCVGDIKESEEKTCCFISV